VSRPRTAPDAQAEARTSGLEPYLRPQQVADLLQVHVKSIYRWAETDPTMPALRTGGLVRFPRDRVVAWLRSREQGAGRRRQSRKRMLSPAEVSPLRAVGESDSAPCAHSCAQPAAPEAS